MLQLWRAADRSVAAEHETRCNEEHNKGTTVTEHFLLRRSVLDAPLTAGSSQRPPDDESQQQKSSFLQQTNALLRVSRRCFNEAAGLRGPRVLRSAKNAQIIKQAALHTKVADRLLERRHFVDRWLLHRQLPVVAKKNIAIPAASGGRRKTTSKMAADDSISNFISLRRPLTTAINPVRSSRTSGRNLVLPSTSAFVSKVN